MKVKNIIRSIRKKQNKEVWIMEYNRDGTVDVRNYPINDIPINELEREVADVYDCVNEVDNYIEIYVI